jgi:poly-gamma-glutamate synthesis protein (capsule biosynthesis protein)
VNLTFGGDVILARDGQALFSSPDQPWQNVLPELQKRQGTALQQFFLVNLESPLTTQEIPQKMDGYQLCASADTLSVLKAADVSLVNLANNHRLDCGTATPQTEALVEQAGIQTVGTGLMPVYFDSNAGRIGLVAADEILDPPAEDDLLNAVAEARAHCDFLVVSLHWGNEFQGGVSAQQRALTQRLADAGVDVLWGTHPHVLQKMEWVKSAERHHEMLAMYSLGNLLSDQWMMPATQRSALVTLKLSGGKIIGIDILPVQMDRVSNSLILPDAEESQRILDDLGEKDLDRAGVTLTW